MFVDFLLLISIGPIIAFFILYLNADRKKSEQYFEEHNGFSLKM